MTASFVQTVVSPTEEEDVTRLESVPAGAVTRKEVAAAIRRETGCTQTESFNVIQWVEGFVKRSRRLDYVTQYPSRKQMSGRNYQVFDAIMPHGMASKPGSAHALLEQLVLDPSRDETSLWHDRRDEPGSPAYCTVQVALGVMQVSDQQLPARRR